MKTTFKKLLSLLLVITFLLPTISSLHVSADIQTELEQVVEGLLDSTTEEIVEAAEDALSLTSAGNWYEACIAGILSWNYFHIEVQNHIRDHYDEVFKELLIKFTQPVKNLVTGKTVTTSSADLYKVNEAVTYLWEVKPASYGSEPKKSKGEEQLNNYITKSINPPVYENGGYKFARTTFTKGNYLRGLTRLEWIFSKIIKQK